MSRISVDVGFAQELVDFWSDKFKRAQELLDEAQKRLDGHAEQEDLARALQTQLQEEVEKRKTAEDELKKATSQWKKDESILLQRLFSEEAEMRQLLTRVAKADAERVALFHQIQQVYSQTTALAVETDASRKKQVAELYPAVSFLEPTFEPRLILFTGPSKLVATLPKDMTAKYRLYFLRRPPNCLPLRVSACGHHGYWFYPPWILPEDVEFELIVEGQADQWIYLGRYVNSILPGAEMKLSEWMNLDEQTKQAYATRIADENAGAGAGAGQKASHAAQLDVQRRYELGEWSVPCYSLRCIGFNMPLYEAMHAALGGAPAPSSAGASAVSIKLDGGASPTIDG